jgi:hypothetical protein
VNDSRTNDRISDDKMSLRHERPFEVHDLLRPITPWVQRLLGPKPGQPCAAWTRRCDFWNWGPGYVRPQCCTTHLLELTRFTHELLDQYGIFHWLDYGSLLGAVRDGHLVPWDSDVDIGIMETQRDALASLAGEVEAVGHVLDTSDPHVARVKLSNINTQHVDLFYWHTDNGMLTTSYYEGTEWPGMTERQTFPCHYIESLESVVLEDYELPAPSPAGRFLAEHRYGPSYLTPTRPVLDTSRYPDLLPEEITPRLEALLSALSQKESELRNLERKKVGRLLNFGLVELWFRSGLPATPSSRRLERLRGTIGEGADGPSVEQLLSSLAVIEQAVDELTSTSATTRVSRFTRRARKLAVRGARGLRDTSHVRPES